MKRCSKCGSFLITSTHKDGAGFILVCSVCGSDAVESTK